MKIGQINNIAFHSAVQNKNQPIQTTNTAESVHKVNFSNHLESYGINSNASLAKAAKLLNKNTVDKLMENGVNVVDPEHVWISPETEIEAGTTILPFVYIEGKNKIGKDCKIGPFSHLRGNVTLGDNVKVGNFVEVKNSVIKSNTAVSHLSYIGDSELGNNVNIGGGTITANYNPITKVKSRTIIKDGANTGSNSVLVAPVVMGENSMLAAGSVATKDIEPNALVVARPRQTSIPNWVQLKKEEFEKNLKQKMN